MATSNPRDVKLGISIETSGGEEIKKLQAQVDSLGDAGRAAVPEFQALADEIGQLAQQRDAIGAFQALSAEMTALTEKQRVSAAASEAQALKLKEAADAANASRVAQAQAAADQAKAAAALKETNGALTILRNSYDANGERVANYKAEVERLTRAKVEQRAALDNANDALKTANAAVREAASAETDLEKASARSAKQAEAAAKAVQAHQAALQTASNAAGELGVSTDNLAASQAEVAQGFNRVESAAQALTSRVQALSNSERELAGIRAFQQQVDDAAALQRAAEYARLFDEAEQSLLATQKAKAAQAADEQWKKEAFAIVEAAEASQRLAREQEILVEVQRQLASSRALEQQAAAAEKLARQADQVRIFTQVLDDLDEKERKAAAAAEEAANRIKNAFGAIGVRSAQDLTLEIANVRTAMAVLASSGDNTGTQLAGAFARGEAKINSLQRELRELNGTLTLGDQAAKLFSNSLGQIAAGNVIADGIGYLVNKVKEMGREFITANVQAETLRRGLTAIYGSSKTAADQIDFLRKAANVAGVSIAGISESFTRFSAATQSASIPLSVTNDLFAAVTRAGSTLGLTGERVTLVLDALGQMASKGVVSMEELRQQLGDSLPGALSLAAKGLGITDAQLVKLVSSGQLAARDFFPALTTGLQTMTGTTDTLATSWERLKNALNTAAVQGGDAGWVDVLKGALWLLKGALGAVILPLAGFSEVLFGAAKAGAVFASSLSWKDKVAELGKLADDAAARQSKLTDAFFGSTEASTAQGAAAAKNAIANAQSSSAALSAAAAQASLAGAVTGAGNAYVQALVKQSENAAATEAAITSSEKLQKAKADEGKALVATAQLTGDASKALDAAAIAATNNVAASEQVVAAREREVNATQTSINLINGQRDAYGKLTDDRQALLDKQTNLLTVQSAALEQDRQQTLELSRQALAAQAASDAYADNSTKVGAYKQAMENAQVVVSILTDKVTAQTAALGELKDQLETGKITQQFYDQKKKELLETTNSLNKATGDAAKFENLYRDAVADSVAAVDRKARAASADLNTTLALVKASQSHYETLSKIATSQGNTAQATEFAVQAKYKEIEAVRLSQQIKNLELDADAKAIEIQRAAIKDSDELAQQKRAELDIRLKIIQAKRIEAGASDDIVRGIQNEIDSIRGLNNARGSGGPGVIGGPGAAPAAPNTAGAAQGTGSVSSPGANSFVGRDGLERRKSDGAAVGTFGNTVPLNLAKAVADRNGQGYGVDDITMLEAAQKQALDAKQFLDAIGRQSAGAVSLEAAAGTRGLVQATTTALDDARRQAAVQKAAAAQPVQKGNKTVTINIGGRSVPINVAGEQDSNNLVGVLRQLENASGTAS